MLCGGVAADHRYGMCTVRCDVVICYAMVWQHVIGMVCVLSAVLSATESHSEHAATPPHNI